MDLNDEQIKLIKFYWRKWQDIAKSTEPVDPEQIVKAVNLLYKAAEQDQPEVFFVSEPNQYYAQAFLCSMPDSIQKPLEFVFRNNPNNIFLDEHQENIAIRLGRQLLLPIERLENSYLRQALEKIKQGKPRSEALQKAFEEIYPTGSKKTLRAIAHVDKQFAQQCGASKNIFLRVSQSSSWMGDVYDSLRSNLEMPRELICEAMDLGYTSDDFNGIGIGCIDRVLLAFASARLDYFKEVLDFQGSLGEEVVQALFYCGANMFFPYEKICVVCDSQPIRQ
jgi:hypothetical protein